MCMCNRNWITFHENGLFCLKVDSGLSFRITKWIFYFEKLITFHLGLQKGLLFSAKWILFFEPLESGFRIFVYT